MPTPSSAAASPATVAAHVQRRTLRLLLATQVIAGVGVAVGVSVGVLLAADLAGAGLSGLAASAAVVGAALLAIPTSRIMRSGGRRPGLAFAYLVGAFGAALVVVAAALGSIPLFFVGAFLFGGGTTANLQARYAAVDLAEPASRGRQLSLVVWATTLGAVAGPILAPLADGVLRRWGLREYSGPFAATALAFTVAALAIFVIMRPDPLLTARQLASGAEVGPARAAGLGAAWHVVRTNPAARLGMAAVAVGHLVMVGVMSMTPVHIGAGMSDHAAVLRVVGVVLSLHIGGMFALAPVAGWLTDRLGRRPVILCGIAVLLIACVLAASAGHETWRLAIALFLLGLGWSGTMVAGSTLLSESVGIAIRPAAQGLNDLVMGLAGASSGALSGLIVYIGGYATLAVLSALATLPLLALTLRPVPALRG
jgi:MFS family permease